MSVDAHCHVDLHSNPTAIVSAAIANRLRVVAVTTTPVAFSISSTFTNVKENIFPALGMHPEVVGDRPHDIDRFAQYLKDVVWVGEVGLDGSRRHSSSWSSQLDVFERVLRECSNLGGRILSIHSRSAARHVLELLEKHPGFGVPVMHWFSGSLSEARDAIALGAYFSVNLAMLQSKAGICITRMIPPNRLLTESDSPFAVNGNMVNLADHLRCTEIELAKVVGCSLPDVKALISENFDALTYGSSLG